MDFVCVLNTLAGAISKWHPCVSEVSISCRLALNTLMMQLFDCMLGRIFFKYETVFQGCFVHGIFKETKCNTFAIFCLLGLPSLSLSDHPVDYLKQHVILPNVHLNLLCIYKLGICMV